MMTVQEKAPGHRLLKEKLDKVPPDLPRTNVRKRSARLADRTDGLDRSEGEQPTEAGNAEKPVSLAVELRTDIVVIDLRADACWKRSILPDAPRVSVLIIHTATEGLTDVTLTNADARVHKDVHRDLPDAVKRVHAGEWVWMLGKHEKPASAEIPVNRLTPKEKEVLELVRRRYTNAEISSELYITLNTVKHHVTNILRKSSKKRRWDLY